MDKLVTYTDYTMGPGIPVIKPTPDTLVFSLFGAPTIGMAPSLYDLFKGTVGVVGMPFFRARGAHVHHHRTDLLPSSTALQSRPAAPDGQNRNEHDAYHP